MIRVSLTLLIFIYLLGFLGVVFISWLCFELRRSYREKLALQHRLRCAICAFEFADATADLLPRCPRCGSLNERHKFSDL